MGKVLFAIGTLAVWGLLIWGNMAIINWANTWYETNMATNYLVDTYEGRALLSQSEYTEFKKSLLPEEVKVNTLDVYGSDNILVIYSITSPEYHAIPFVEPKSEKWYYDTNRAWDFGVFAFAGFFSLIIGLLFTAKLYSSLYD